VSQFAILVNIKFAPFTFFVYIDTFIYKYFICIKVANRKQVITTFVKSFPFYKNINKNPFCSDFEELVTELYIVHVHS